MASYYNLLGVEPGASQDEIAAAYKRQRERYDPARVADLDLELRQVAEERSTALERAYNVLSDTRRRHQYDAGLHDTGSSVTTARRGLTTREVAFAVGGVLVAMALIATIWVFTGRDAAPTTQAMSEVNRPAPTFAVPALDGGTVSLADYEGQVVLLNFWGTWCEPCKRELPALQSAHQQFEDEGLAIIGVNLTDDELSQGRDQATIKAFLEQFGVTYPIALDLQGELTNDYRVFPLPTSFFIDGQGRIRYVHIGELTLDDVTARFNELRQEASAPRTQ